MGGRWKGRWRFLFYKCLFAINLFLIYAFIFYSFCSLENFICWLFDQNLYALGELRPYLVGAERTKKTHKENTNGSATPDAHILCVVVAGTDFGN